MDLSLEELQAAFRQVQKEESVQRLSERNCVELMLKLIELRLVDVLYTLSGKEYVTPRQLEREILDELLQHRGRLNVLELPALLGVDSAYIERAVETLLRREGGGGKHHGSGGEQQLQVHDGELLSGYYLDSVAAEINEALADAGHVSLESLARRFSLSAELVEQLIRRRLGRQIEPGARLDGDTLYTQRFVERHRALLRGAFAGVTRPTAVSAVLSAQQVGATEVALCQATLDEMLADGLLPGTLQGRRDRATYVPAVFSAGRQAWVDAFFAQNGYVDYAAVERLQWAQPRAWLEQHFGAQQGLALPGCFVSRRLVQQIDSLVHDTVASASWLDVAPLVPPALTPADLFMLLQACPSLSAKAKGGSGGGGGGGSGRACELLGEHYVVSRGFLEQTLQRYETHVGQLAKLGTLQPVAASTTAAAASAAPASSQPSASPRGADDDAGDDADETSGGKRGKGGKGGKSTSRGAAKKKQQQQEAAAEKRDDKGARGGGGKKQQQQHASPSGGGDTATADREQFVKQAVSELSTWLSECPEELLLLLVRFLRPQLLALREQAARAAWMAQEGAGAGVGGRKQRLERIDSLYSMLQLALRAAATVPPAEVQQQLERQAVRTLGADLVNALLDYLCADLPGSVVGPVRTAQERAAALSALAVSGSAAPAVHKALQKVTAALSKSAAELLLAEFEAASAPCELMLRKLDKKREKQMLLSQRVALLDQLATESNPANCLLLVVASLFVRLRGQALQPVGRCAAALVAALRDAPGLSPDAFHLLDSFQSEVAGWLQLDDGDERRQAVHEQLQAKLPDLKALVERPSADAADSIKLDST